ncbi:NAD(P)/FAD-dependent oxidoreductase [Flavobacterium sp.]|jgi:glycine/D-amino acid oxidase-like deaminating enzyme|uniref:NAD(P)/FAD-dependent oxidoreductase n=1 Tax=Flavobacterium sp. TaxID=239 RepID=UPI0037C13AA3
MQLSYWEIKNWFTNVDFTIVGSGIVGLHAALALRERFPSAKILVLEKGVLPQGASTKNAGFACFGSLSEIIDDLETHSEDTVVQLIQKRFAGLQLLRKNLGDKALSLKSYGGYELFLKEDELFYEECRQKMPFINKLLQPHFKSDVFSKQGNRFQFSGITGQLIFNPFEAQIDTGNMMQALLKKAHQNDILILNSQTVTHHQELNEAVEVTTNGITFKTNKLLFTTNGFAAQLTHNQVQPARAQVLITKPIPNLALKGTFHLDRGYYYFRNINDRILLGGGRNLDFEGETTTSHETTDRIQNRLEDVLKNVILPQQSYEIEHRWSGTMGMGTHKNPIVQQLSNHVYCGVRMGGMGVAIGSLIGQEVADLI